jgi:hypothetical protein
LWILSIPQLISRLSEQSKCFLVFSPLSSSLILQADLLKIIYYCSGTQSVFCFPFSWHRFE